MIEITLYRLNEFAEGCFAIGKGADADVLFELCGEMSRIGEIQSVGYFFDTVFRRA